MLGRIPLSAILTSAAGGRHKIPSTTYKAADDSLFFQYLDSDDTRLPTHPLLNPYQHPPEDYDTYVGEDVWLRQPSDDSSDDEAPVEVRFDDVVNWVAHSISADWATDGVVLCGKYVVADDCPWAVPSHSPAVFSAKEVFRVMRCSTKFMEDIHHQIRECANCAYGSDDAQLQYLEFSLVKSMAKESAREFRMFVPYLLSLDESTEKLRSCSESEYKYTLQKEDDFIGISQRITEVCFPSLMSWTEQEHHARHECLVARVEETNLLSDISVMRHNQLIQRLLSRWLRRRRDDQPFPPVSSFVLIVAVDVLFDSESLPIFVLSAKFRLFAAAQSPESAGLREHFGQHDWYGSAAPFIEVPPNASGSDGPERRDESDSDEDNCCGGDIGSFFRLFRNQFNWNQYVMNMERRRALMRSGTSDIPSIPDDGSRGKLQKFCVVAAESSDLTTCRDAFEKRGLPLELRRPELLTGNKEGVELLERLRENISSQ